MHKSVRRLCSVDGITKCLVTVQLVLIFGLLSSYVHAQQIRFDHLSVKEGLSQGNVLDIYQDKLGFIWIASEDGLNLYDGYTCTIFRNNPKDSTSISNNNIYSIAEDGNGNLWLGTQGGLNRYDRVRNVFDRYTKNSGKNGSLSDNIVICVFLDSKNNVWAGTANGLNRFDPANNTFKQFLNDPANSTSLPHNEIKAIFEDTQNHIWIGTSGGLSMLGADEKSFINYTHNPDDPTSLSSNKITTLYQDQKDNVWVGTIDGGLNLMSANGKFTRYAPDANDPESIASPFIHNLDESSGGDLWIATDGGLNLKNINGKFKRIVADPEDENSLSSGIVTKVYFDRQDRVWVGTRFGGVNIYDKEKYAFWHFKHNSNEQNSINNNTINSFEEDEKGNIWIATDGGGLNYYDRASGVFSHLVHDEHNKNSLPGNKVLSVKLDNRGGLWAGMWGTGLTYYDRVNKRFRHYLSDPNDPASLGDNNIFYIMEDRKGNLWMATWGSGICKYDKKTDTFKTYAHDSSNPNSISGQIAIHIIEDHNGMIWIATRQAGLNMFDPETETFVHYKAGTAEGDLTENAVFTLFEDSSQRLWVGTNGGGLNLFDSNTKKFNAFRQNDGLPNDVIMGIVEDDQKNLWVSTNKGLCKFNPDKQTFKNYDEGDGLQSNQFNRWAFMKLTSGELLFGGINGFNLFNPTKILDNPYKPPVYITDFKLYNKSVPIGEKEVLKKNIIFTEAVMLDYTQNFFSFDFTALNYRQSAKNQYQYIMEGFQDEWIDAGGERKVSYTNLSPGDYTFRVRASNNDGVWNMEGAALKITVIPPFWRTWWFITAVVTLLGSIIIGYVRYQRTKVKRQKRELEATIEDRTREIKTQSEEIVKKNELEKVQNWITQGQAHFSEIISKYKGNLDELSTEVLKNLVKYVGGHMGVMAIAVTENENDQYLKVVATYGVSYKDDSRNRIELGEGLIGSVFIDKEKRILHNLPENYFKIESGLGKANATELVLLPLKTDDNEILGVIEIAFFVKSSDTVQQFLDKVAGVIALNVHAANLSHKTMLLLQQAKEQTEELMAQEEEMRQNMEELEATQEELKRREEAMQQNVKKLEESQEAFKKREAEYQLAVAQLKKELLQFRPESPN
jgi:ligand-binding sensor domain-containing protein